MHTQDIKELKRSYGMMDYMAQVARRCDMEQMAQGAQMRRIEKWFNKCGNAIDELKERMIRLEERVIALERQTKERFDKIEDSLAILTKNMGLIMKHLGIE